MTTQNDHKNGPTTHRELEISRVYLPGGLDELWELMEAEPEIALCAGGTDLLVRMKSGEVTSSGVICLDRIPELKGIEDHGAEVFIGAVATHNQILESESIATLLPALTSAISVLGSPQIRNMGTIGGNIVNASPAGDTLAPLHVLNAEVELMARGGSRRMPLASFVLGPGKVDLRPNEILTGVRIPKRPDFPIHHYEKVGKRKALACAIASMAATLRLSDDGTIEAIGLAWGSVGPTVVRAPEVEEMLAGRRLDLETLRKAARVVEETVRPIDDIRASANYRKVVAGRLLFRLLNYAPK